MAHGHVKGYLKTERCDLLAVADINRENAEAFAEQYGGAAVYTDYIQMLAVEELDIVSVCTWPHLHAPMAMAAAESGVKAVHCEKPMAPTWGEAKRMHSACADSGVQLTFNHQRRFLEPFQRAKQMLDAGEIGELQRLEGQCADIFDWGTHWLDMFCYYNGETPAEWVIGQIDSREEKRVFGVPLENQSIAHVKYANGVRGLLVTGFEAAMGCANRLVGDQGVIEIGWEAPWLRVRTEAAAGWRVVETAEGIHDSVALERATADVVRGLDTGERPLLSSFNALHATEVIFATYYSAMRSGRVDLPLQYEGNAFHDMLERGEVGPGEA
jgi:predicted dehydrogenase